MNTKDIIERLKNPVDIEQLIDKLSFDLDNFEQANLEQPPLYLEAGRYLTWTVLEKARAEVKLETRTAEVAINWRKAEKLTDKGVASMVESAPEVVKLKQQLYLAKASEVWAKQLVEAYTHRLQVLNNITKIRTAETSSALRAIKERDQVRMVRQEAVRMRQKYDREPK